MFPYQSSGLIRALHKKVVRRPSPVKVALENLYIHLYNRLNIVQGSGLPNTEEVPGILFTVASLVALYNELLSTRTCPT